MTKKPTLTIPLTTEQKEQIRKASGKEVTTLRLEALEPRLTPGGNLN